MHSDWGCVFNLGILHTERACMRFRHLDSTIICMQGSKLIQKHAKTGFLGLVLCRTECRSALTMTRCKCLNPANRKQSACACGFVIDIVSMYEYSAVQHTKLASWAAHSICTNPGIFALSVSDKQPTCHPNRPTTESFYICFMLHRLIWS